MRLEQFFKQHLVFTVTELGEFLVGRGSNTASNRRSLLAHHRKQGHIVRVRRGLYAVVQFGQDPASCAVDPYLLAAKMADDAVVGYHTALELFGKAYASFQEFQFLTATAARSTTFRDYHFRAIKIPKRLLSAGKQLHGVETVDRAGLDARVTGLERTMVDVLDRPDLGGGWEEIWRSLESVEFFDLDRVVDYALLLGNATTVGKVGFFLEQHASELMVEDKHLARLRAHRPTVPHYLDRRSKGATRFVGAWNVVVPAAVFDRSWQAVA